MQKLDFQCRRQKTHTRAQASNNESRGGDDTHHRTLFPSIFVRWLCQTLFTVHTPSSTGRPPRKGGVRCLCGGGLAGRAQRFQTSVARKLAPVWQIYQQHPFCICLKDGRWPFLFFFWYFQFAFLCGILLFFFVFLPVTQNGEFG
jgi:hypothetical protein